MGFQPWNAGTERTPVRQRRHSLRRDQKTGQWATFPPSVPPITFATMTQAWEPYELIDFGDGRKLERFGERVLDRVAPAAEGFAKKHRAAWSQATMRYLRTSAEQGEWSPTTLAGQSWIVDFGLFSLELKATPFGHIGVFAEQLDNWQWIARRIARAGRPLKVLNLFAYTGGSTLAAAAAGAELTHVDAAKNVVAWARRNAEISQLADKPSRWIVEDAATFVRRELKRGRQYDAVILDPPSYGHGPAGEDWKIDRDLPTLLGLCGELTASQRSFLLLTCHSPNLGPADVQALLADAVFGHCQSGASATPLTLRTNEHRQLPAGIVARWPPTL